MKEDLKSLILTKHEIMIMHVIWGKNEATVRDVFNVISRKRKIAYTTISSEMRRLVKKGALSSTEKNGAYYYQYVYSQQQAMDNHLRYLIDTMFDGDPEKLLEYVIRNMFELKDLMKIMGSSGWRRSITRMN